MFGQLDQHADRWPCSCRTKSLSKSVGGGGADVWPQSHSTTLESSQSVMEILEQSSFDRTDADLQPFIEHNSSMLSISKTYAMPEIHSCAGGAI